MPDDNNAGPVVRVPMPKDWTPDRTSALEEDSCQWCGDAFPSAPPPSSSFARRPRYFFVPRRDGAPGHQAVCVECLLRTARPTERAGDQDEVLRLRAALAAMTLARDEACTWIADRSSADSLLVARLRAVGKPTP